MPDDDDKAQPALSPTQARVYRDYLITCRPLGIMPTLPERAKALLEEWAAMVAAGQTNWPTTH